jgi:hypothetical protein
LRFFFNELRDETLRRTNPTIGNGARRALLEIKIDWVGLDVLSANVALLREAGLIKKRTNQAKRDKHMSDLFHGGGAYIIADQLRQMRDNRVVANCSA